MTWEPHVSDRSGGLRSQRPRLPRVHQSVICLRQDCTSKEARMVIGHERQVLPLAQLIALVAIAENISMAAPHQLSRVDAQHSPRVRKPSTAQRGSHADTLHHRWWSHVTEHHVRMEAPCDRHEEQHVRR